MTAKLVWITPGADELVAYMARVSNPENQDNPETAPRLIRYLINNRHWSPFEMVNACVEIETTREIGRQILRHRSFSFQEFSGRYASFLGPDRQLLHEKEARLQDKKNRQNSIDTTDKALLRKWNDSVDSIAEYAEDIYKWALDNGIAKECARAVLPEGLVPTRMYMNGTIRSWIHYCKERTEAGVQKEHRELAEQIQELVFNEIPMIKEAIFATEQ